MTSSREHLQDGHRHMQAGELDEAERCYRRARNLDPSAANPVHFLGMVIFRREETRGLELLRQSVQMSPGVAAFYNNLGKACGSAGLLDEALAALLRAVELKPDNASAWTNLGGVQRALGDASAASDSFARSVGLDPAYAKAHWNFGLTRLLLGDFAVGLDEYEWRWKIEPIASTQRQFAQPLWTGQNVAGRRILLHAEQGFGDSIQMSRYAPLLARRGATVILAAHPELRNLLSTLGDDVKVLSLGDAPPNFDLHCPLMSLARAFATRLETIPANVPYLFAEQAKIDSWRARLSDDGATRRIGICLSGNPAHEDDRNRSCPADGLDALQPPADVRFYDLQKNAGKKCSLRVVDHTADLNDFSDTAAMIECLDLVITVDTAVAHLAGAIGKPVWLLLPFAADWRWLLNRDDSPWYPTMRLFRQKSRGGWRGVIERVAAALSSAER